MSTAAAALVTRKEIAEIVRSITPLDETERAHIEDVFDWIASGVEIFRQRKPDVPPKHLVSYFLLWDAEANKILLVDHIKAGLWLPAGGHVEPHEHPVAAVKREANEELGIEANFLLPDPLFLTVTRTVGETAGHTDVSLWYVLIADEHDRLSPDPSEFREVHWFDPGEVPIHQSDPHMRRFLEKLSKMEQVNENSHTDRRNRHG